MTTKSDENSSVLSDAAATSPSTYSADVAEVVVNIGRWLVDFRSGEDWYRVGEFIALTEAAAIEQAIDVFGTATAYRAEEIPWNTAPLPQRLPKVAGLE
jgi:hypothetical protein